MEHPFVVRRRRNPLEVRQLLERFDQSGLTAVAFAKNEGLHMSTFYRQLRRRSRRLADAQNPANHSAKVDFVEVDTTTSLSPKKAKILPRHPLSPPNSAYRISLRAWPQIFSANDCRQSGYPHLSGHHANRYAQGF
jgi:hypothetical protein